MTSNRYPHLLSPGKIGTLELKNRIAVTAMGVSLSEDDGTVGEQLIAYHEEQARGGAGKMQFFCDGDETAKVAQFHGLSSVSCKFRLARRRSRSAGDAG